MQGLRGEVGVSYLLGGLWWVGGGLIGVMGVIWSCVRWYHLYLREGVKEGCLVGMAGQ